MDDNEHDPLRQLAALLRGHRRHAAASRAGAPGFAIAYGPTLLRLATTTPFTTPGFRAW